MGVHKSPMILGMQALAPATGTSNPVMAEVKARSLSNQLEMLERRMSLDQIVHLSTNDSVADN